MWTGPTYTFTTSKLLERNQNEKCISNWAFLCVQSFFERKMNQQIDWYIQYSYWKRSNVYLVVFVSLLINCNWFHNCVCALLKSNDECVCVRVVRFFSLIFFSENVSTEMQRILTHLIVKQRPKCQMQDAKWYMLHNELDASNQLKCNVKQTKLCIHIDESIPIIAFNTSA